MNQFELLQVEKAGIDLMSSVSHCDPTKFNPKNSLVNSDFIDIISKFQQENKVCG